MADVAAEAEVEAAVAVAAAAAAQHDAGHSHCSDLPDAATHQHSVGGPFPAAAAAVRWHVGAVAGQTVVADVDRSSGGAATEDVS